MIVLAQQELNKLSQEVGAYLPLILFLGFWFLVVLFLGIVLRTGCSLFNSLVGGKDAAESVPMPSMLGSMILVVIAWIVSYAIAIAVVWAFAHLAQATNLSPVEAAYRGWSLSLPIAFVVLIVMLALFLPASFFRAFIIVLLCLPVAVVLLVLIFVVLRWLSTTFHITIPAFTNPLWQA